MAINDLFGRTETSRWTAKEMEAFHDGGLDQLAGDTFADHVGVLAEYYQGRRDWLKSYWGAQEGQDFRRRTPRTLLENWSEKVDKARPAALYLKERRRQDDAGRL